MPSNPKKKEKNRSGSKKTTKNKPSTVFDDDGGEYVDYPESPVMGKAKFVVDDGDSDLLDSSPGGVSPGLSGLGRLRPTYKRSLSGQGSLGHESDGGWSESSGHSSAEDTPPAPPKKTIPTTRPFPAAGSSLNSSSAAKNKPATTTRSFSKLKAPPIFSQPSFGDDNDDDDDDDSDEDDRPSLLGGSSYMATLKPPNKKTTTATNGGGGPPGLSLRSLSAPIIERPPTPPSPSSPENGKKKKLGSIADLVESRKQLSASPPLLSTSTGSPENGIITPVVAVAAIDTMSATNAGDGANTTNANAPQTLPQEVPLSHRELIGARPVGEGAGRTGPADDQDDSNNNLQEFSARAPADGPIRPTFVSVSNLRNSFEPLDGPGDARAQDPDRRVYDEQDVDEYDGVDQAEEDYAEEQYDEYEDDYPRRGYDGRNGYGNHDHPKRPGSYAEEMHPRNRDNGPRYNRGDLERGAPSHFSTESQYLEEQKRVRRTMTLLISMLGCALVCLAALAGGLVGALIADGNPSPAPPTPSVGPGVPVLVVTPSPTPPPATTLVPTKSAGTVVATSVETLRPNQVLTTAPSTAPTTQPPTEAPTTPATTFAPSQSTPKPTTSTGGAVVPPWTGPATLGNSTANLTANSTVNDQALYSLVAGASPSGSANLQVQGSAQYLAYKWLESDATQKQLEPYRKLQRYALAVLYYSTSGSVWTNSRGWLSDLDECLWYSQSAGEFNCDTNSFYKIIEFHGNNVVGQLPPELGMLTSMQQIIIDSNGGAGLTGSIPSELGQLSMLSTLDLQGNAFSQPIPPELFTQLAGLTMVDLSNNKIPGSIPTSVGNLVAATLLSLANNRLTGPIPTQLNGAVSLQQLRLDGNTLSGTVPDLPALTKIQSFHIENNNLVGSVSNGTCAAIKLFPAEAYADCTQVTCSCCTFCCVKGGNCSKI